MGRCSRSSTSRKPADHVCCLQHRSTNTSHSPSSLGTARIALCTTTSCGSPLSQHWTDLSLRTVQRYGKEITQPEIRPPGHGRLPSVRAHIHSRWSVLLLQPLVLMLLLCCLCGSYSVAPSTCDSIAELRRQIQVVGADHVIFLDEVPSSSTRPRITLVVPGSSRS